MSVKDEYAQAAARTGWEHLWGEPWDDLDETTQRAWLGLMQAALGEARRLWLQSVDSDITDPYQRRYLTRLREVDDGRHLRQGQQGDTQPPVEGDVTWGPLGQERW